MMHSWILRALATLLAISPLLHAAPFAELAAPSGIDHSTATIPTSYRHRRDGVYGDEDSDSILDEYKSWTGVTDDTVPSKRSEVIDVDEYALAERFQALDLVGVSGGTNVVKRTNFIMRKQQGWDDTWRVFVPEEPVPPGQPGWTVATIRSFARYAYANMMDQGAGSVTVVSALWVPGKGCYIGSLPKDAGQEKFAINAPIVAPLLWKYIKDRKVTLKEGETYPLYHSEDMACFEYARWQTPVDQYPDGSIVLSYGFTADMPGAGPIKACYRGKSGISPPCKEAMNELGIGV